MLWKRENCKFIAEAARERQLQPGLAIREASRGRSVFVVQFLKGKYPEEISFIQRLEPEIKMFRFQKREDSFEDLTPQEKEEEIPNLRNGLNFAKKVLATRRMRCADSG